jgi:hypothetical protein
LTGKKTPRFPDEARRSFLRPFGLSKPVRRRPAWLFGATMDKESRATPYFASGAKSSAQPLVQ